MDSPFIEGDQVSAGQESESSAAQGYASSSSMAPSLGEYVGSQVGTATGQLFRFAGNQAAKHFDAPEQPILDADTANKNYAPEGEKLFIDSVPESVAKSIGRARANELDRNAIIGRYADQHNALVRFPVDVAAYLLDPLRAATSFIPGVGEEAIIAELGEGLLSKTVARAVSGSTGMVAATAPVVAAQYAIGQTEGSDYDLNAAFRDLVFAAPMGAFMHAGINPMLGYAFRQSKAALGYEVKGTEQAPPAVNLAPLDPHIEAQAEQFLNTDAFTREAAMRASVAQTVDGRPVDVSPIIPDHTEAARTVAPEAFNEYDALREERYDVAQRLAPRDEEGEEPARIVLSEAGRVLPNDVRVNFEQALSEQAPSSEPLYALSGGGGGNDRDNIPPSVLLAAQKAGMRWELLPSKEGQKPLFSVRDEIVNPDRDVIRTALKYQDRFNSPYRTLSPVRLRWVLRGNGDLAFGDANSKTHVALLGQSPEAQPHGYVFSDGTIFSRSSGPNRELIQKLSGLSDKPVVFGDELLARKIIREMEKVPSSEPLFALSGENQNRPRTPTEVAVYHGTNQPFDKFDQSKTIRSNLATGEKENAFYFSDTPETANSYLHHFDPNEPATDTGQNVLKSFIETKNFKTVDFDGHDFSRDGGIRLASEISQAKKEGYHGLIANDIGDLGGTQNQYVTWTPGTVRAALSDNQLYALNGFHHGPEQAVESFSQNKADAGTWKKVIEGRSGWKDYSDWTGVHDFLGDRKTISKDELLSYMRAHSADLDEKVLGGKTSPEIEAMESRRKALESELDALAENPGPHNDPRLKEITKELDHLNIEGIRAEERLPQTKFDAHRIPGGEPGSYRELLIRQPSLGETTFDRKPYEDRAQAIFDQMEGASPERLVELQGDLDDLQKELHNNIDESKPKYTSKHFNDQELAHIRFDDRVGPNGEKTLFINEIQSDLHQHGRGFGYDTQGLRDHLGRLESERDALEREYYRLEGEGKPIEADAVWQKRLAVHAEITEINKGKVNLSPNAPFKGELWLELALKRSLRYAVEHGYDAISWARSDQIAKAVGADPENLKIQYDQKIGKFLDKYTKKWGAKVERESILPHENKYDLSNRLANAVMEGHGGNVDAALAALRSTKKFHERAAVNEYPEAVAKLLEFKKDPLKFPKVGTNPILRITPQMRESVMGGQAYNLRPEDVDQIHKAFQTEGQYRVPDDVISENFREFERGGFNQIAPKEAPLHSIVMIEPDGLGGLTAYFSTKDGVVQSFPASDEMLNARGFYLANVGIFVNRLSALSDVNHLLRGVIYHEIVHSVSPWNGSGADRISSEVWKRLLGHANSSKILDAKVYEYATKIGDPLATTYNKNETLRQVYTRGYRNRTKAERVKLFQDEEAAFLVEGYYHDRLTMTQDELVRAYGPVIPDLENILAGRFDDGRLSDEKLKEIENEVAELDSRPLNDEEWERFNRLRNLLASHKNDNPQYALSDKERMTNRPRTPTEVKVYHGTYNEFERFSNDGYHFFSDDPSLANNYATGHVDDDNPRSVVNGGDMVSPRVVPSFIETKNFKTVDMHGGWWNPLYDHESSSNKAVYAALKDAKNEGFSGLIFKNMRDAWHDAPLQNQYVTWTPGTVRSALSDNPLYALSDNKERGAITDTPEFKRWFSGSKVVGGDGKPLVVYHGTNAAFDAFDLNKVRRGGEGFWFTSAPNFANRYAESEVGGNVVPAFLKIERPAYTVSEWYRDETGKFDGLILNDKFLVRDPTQIKSAIGNRGTFDSNDPRITYALSGGGKDAQPENPRDVIIKVAMDGDPVKSFNAQAVRALKSLNLFTDKEWGALEQEARSKAWVETEKVKSAGAGDHLETAISEQYAEWRSGKEMSQPTTSIFQRIKDFFERAANYLRGHGFQNAEDVFERIRSGELKDRYEAPFKDRLNEINGRMQELAPQIKAAYARAAATASGPTFAQVSSQQSQLYRDGYSPAIPQSELRQNMEQIYGDKSNNSEGTPEESAKGTGNAKPTDQKGRSDSQAGTSGKVAGASPIDQELAEAQVRHAQMVDNGFQPTEEEARNFLQISQEMEQAAYLEQAYSQAATCLAQAGI